MNLTTKKLTAAALTGAAYAVLSYFGSVFGITYGPIQCRFSEALCVLPFFLPAAVPGLFVGCLLANLMTGAVVWDILFGSLATLLGALGARGLAVLAQRADAAGRHRHAAVLNVLIPLPTVVANTVIVPLILHYAYGLPDALPYLFLTVGLGEVLSAWVLGLLLLRVLKKVLPGIHRRQS